MSLRRSILASTAVLACLALTLSPQDAVAQIHVGGGEGAQAEDRSGPGPRAPGVAAAGVVLTLAGTPLLVGGVTLLVDGVARDERRELEAIDDIETSGGVLLLGGGAILVGAGIPTIVWGLSPDDEPERPSAAPTVAVQPRGASATWRF